MAMSHTTDLDRDRVLRQIGGDREDSPWMVSTEPHLFLIIALIQALSRALAPRGPWHVGGEAFVVYGPNPDDQVAPDIYAAPVADYARQRYVVAQEGLFPPFVLEVVSPESRKRDLEDKVVLYETLGAQEYVIVDLHQRRRQITVQLRGYRRGATGRFEPWPPDATGRLWSALLQVWLEPEDAWVRVFTASGTPVLSLQELEDARQAAEQDHLREAAARQAAENALRAAEEEIARLRAALQSRQHPS